MDPSGVPLAGSNDGPPEGAFLGGSLGYAGRGSNSWRLFEAFLRLAPYEL